MFYFRLLTTGSIEEKIFQRQLSKAGLNEAVVDPSHTSAVRLSDEELKVTIYNWTNKAKHKEVERPRLSFNTITTNGQIYLYNISRNKVKHFNIALFLILFCYESKI